MGVEWIIVVIRELFKHACLQHKFDNEVFPKQEGRGGDKIFTCPYPLKVQACPP